jgi:hypothetical protein
MLKKGFAYCVLLLALSPFTAPFQADSGDEHQIASIEPLSAIRQHADLRTLTPHLPEQDCVGIIPTLSESILFSSTVPAGTLTPRNRHRLMGAYFALATVLRL